MIVFPIESVEEFFLNAIIVCSILKVVLDLMTLGWRVVRNCKKSNKIGN